MKRHIVNLVPILNTPVNMENKIQELTDKIYREGVEKETRKRKDLSRMLRKKLRKSLRMPVKRRNQL